MTISVRIDQRLHVALRRAAAAEGVTVAEFVRRAITERLEAKRQTKTPYELGRHLFGKFSSGRSDLSTRYKELYREKMRAKHRRPR